MRKMRGEDDLPTIYPHALRAKSSNTKADKRELEHVDLQQIVSILLQVSERPRTIDELGLTRQDALKLVETGYFEWKRVIYPTEKGRELAKWLLRGREEDEIGFFEAVKREAIIKLASSGNRVVAGMEMLEPIHVHVMRKLKDNQPVFQDDVERKALKQLIKWGLAKRVGSYGIPSLTRLGQEFLTCFEGAAKKLKPIVRVREVMEEG